MNNFECTNQFFNNYYALYKPLEDKMYNNIETNQDAKKCFGLSKLIDEALISSFYFDTLTINDIETLKNMRRSDIFDMFDKKI